MCSRHPCGACISFCTDDLSNADCNHILANAHELASVFCCSLCRNILSREIPFVEDDVHELNVSVASPADTEVTPTSFGESGFTAFVANCRSLVSVSLESMFYLVSRS